VVERRGLVVHVDDDPTFLLNAWMTTRPQDWTPRQAELLFSRRPS